MTDTAGHRPDAGNGTWQAMRLRFLLTGVHLSANNNDMLNRYITYKLLPLFMLLALTPSFCALAAKDTFTVVIDPGHGGKDIGAADNNVREKDINLGVALELGELIKNELKDVKVVFTRDDDTYYTLQQRADKANKAKGDLFISIHTNSVDKSNKNRTTVAGASVYALGLHKDANNMAVARRENAVIELEKNFEQKYSGFDPNSDESYIIFEMAQKKNLAQSIRFADEVQKQLVKTAGRRDRGVHQAGFWVLWATSMPAVLIELDFICNPNSAKYISSPQGQNKLAESICNAIKTYRKSLHKTSKPDTKRGKDRAEADGSPDAPTAIAAARTDDTPREHVAPASYERRETNAATKRRRRSLAARNASAARNVEVASINLSSHRATTETEVTENPDMADATVAAQPEADSKKRKRKTNSAQKQRRTAVKDKEVRMYNNKHIVISNDREVADASKSDNTPARRSRRGHQARTERVTTIYSIQVLASPEHLKSGNPRFCGFSPIRTFKEHDLYKYTYGESESREEIEKLLKKVRTKIPDAFVVKNTKSTSSVR